MSMTIRVVNDVLCDKCEQDGTADNPVFRIWASSPYRCVFVCQACLNRSVRIYNSKEKKKRA